MRHVDPQRELRGVDQPFDPLRDLDEESELAVALRLPRERRCSLIDRLQAVPGMRLERADRERDAVAAFLDLDHLDVDFLTAAQRLLRVARYACG